MGRSDIGSLEPRKRADLAIWRTDGLELGGAADAALRRAERWVETGRGAAPADGTLR